MDAAFWRPVLSALGTMPTGFQTVPGASGIEHRAIDVGIDRERKRLVVLNDAADPLAAAFIQSDVQRQFPDQRVIVARPTLVNVGESLRGVARGFGFQSARLTDIQARFKDTNSAANQQVIALLFGQLFSSLGGDPRLKSHSAGAFFLQIINQVTKLNWSDLAKEDINQSVLSIDSLLAGADADIERQLGICVLPIYSVTADEVESIKTAASLDPARELLQKMGAWEYFFPDGEELALGLIDRGFDSPQTLRDAVALAPRHGHLIAEREEVPKLDTILAALQARGLIAEIETKLKVDIDGQRVRATLKAKPKEALLVKLKHLAWVPATVVKIVQFMSTGTLS